MAETDQNPVIVRGEKVTIPLVAKSGNDRFFLDILIGKIVVKKGKIQLRFEQDIILLRLDYHGPPHSNPDHKMVSGSHLHRYQEGSGDQWAFEVQREDFSNLDDHEQTLHDFLKYCSIKEFRFSMAVEDLFHD